jgi:hypothetical protein
MGMEVVDWTNLAEDTLFKHDIEPSDFVGGEEFIE